jgi:polysaccharide pyruvyl transferase WcaK-like protein
MTDHTKSIPVFIIMGASLDTGNLGVSALLASIVKCIDVHYSDYKLYLMEGVRNPLPQVVALPGGKKVEIGRIGIRRNKTVWRQNHLLRLIISTAFARMLPDPLREKWLSRNPYLNAIVSAQAVLDITGGDSFSDIYGMWRLATGCLEKLLVLLCKADLTLLPQTYGPFQKRLSQFIARWVIVRAANVFCRDEKSVEQVHLLVNRRSLCSQPQLSPDVAFVLDAIRPDTSQTAEIERLKNTGCELIGLNISGLLYHGGYTGHNEFGLSLDYKQLASDIISYFARRDNVKILLTPHVIPNDMPVENDCIVCHEIQQSLPVDMRKKTIVLEGDFGPNEIKYLIGQCDFFIGARMHATIAALSQCIPAIGTAYSKKFAGVFQTVGVEDCVVDLRACDLKTAMSSITSLYEAKDTIRKRLENVIPGVKKKVISLFENKKAVGL